MPWPRLRAYPKETVVAEKLEAIVQLGDVNTRMKDFYDLWHLSRGFRFDGGTLAQAIANTFSARRTPIPRLPPVGLIDQFAMKNQGLWQAYLTRTGDNDERLSSLAGVSSHLRGFVLPPMQAVSDGERFTQTWTDEGGWQSTA